MRMKYSIGLLIFSVMIICFSYMLIDSDNTDDKLSEKESALVTKQNIKKDGYYLYEKNGYVVVFLHDQKTLYEYTDIKYDMLPENIRQEISEGKYIESIEELYGFLENYSS